MFKSIWRIYSSATLGQIFNELLDKISYALDLLHIPSILYIFCCELLLIPGCLHAPTWPYFLTAWGNRGVSPVSVASRIHAAGPRLQISSATAISAAFWRQFPVRGLISVLLRPEDIFPVPEGTGRAGPHQQLRTFAPVTKNLKQVLLCLVGKDGWAKAKRESDSRLFPSILDFKNTAYTYFKLRAKILIFFAVLTFTEQWALLAQPVVCPCCTMANLTAK